MVRSPNWKIGYNYKMLWLKCAQYMPGVVNNFAIFLSILVEELFVVFTIMTHSLKTVTFGRI